MYFPLNGRAVSFEKSKNAHPTYSFEPKHNAASPQSVKPAPSASRVPRATPLGKKEEDVFYSVHFSLCGNLCHPLRCVFGDAAAPAPPGAKVCRASMLYLKKKFVSRSIFLISWIEIWRKSRSTELRLSSHTRTMKGC